MELDRYIQGIRRQVEAAAEAGGEEARPVAERLMAPLEAAIRLALLDAVAAAAEEITLDLAPGSVELRLRGRDAEFVVTPPPADPFLEETTEEDAAWPGVAPGEGEEISRINLRLPEPLKARVERAAGGEGLSVNSWLVRSAALALERSDPGRRRERRTPRGPQRYTGWAR